VYGYTFLGQASYLLVLGTSLQQCFFSDPLCLDVAIAIGCVVLLVPVCSVRKLSESVLLCLFNTVLISHGIRVALHLMRTSYPRT